MNKLTLVVARSLVVAALFAVPLFAGDDEALKKDLTAVIALQGLPCGQVVAVTELANRISQLIARLLVADHNRRAVARQKHGQVNALAREPNHQRSSACEHLARPLTNL